MSFLLLIPLLLHGGTERGNGSGFVVEITLDRPTAGGQLRVALCPDERSYGSECGCVVQDIAASGDRIQVIFHELHGSHGAIKVFHDVNGNGKLDTNWLGIPTEPYGFSNDASAPFGPPSYQKASVRFEGTIGIRMRSIVG